LTPFIFPLSSEEPQPLSPAEVADFAARVGWVDDVAAISSETTAVARQPLPWWRGVELIVAADPAWHDGNGTVAWLLDTHLHRLDGESKPIHVMNAQNRPVLDEGNVLPYLGFFCWYVRGEGGPFTILQSPDDRIFPLRPDAEGAADVARLLRPATLLERRDDGFHCEATIWYSDALFVANFIVGPDGMVSMIEDDPLMPELGMHIRSRLTFDRIKPTTDETGTA
jgi:hypothetical protein